jgi:hypothetical protein
LRVRRIKPAVSGEDRNALYAGMIATAKRGARRNAALRGERKARRAERASRNSFATRWGLEKKRRTTKGGRR